MARPRRTPRTAFGAWLGQWLDEHPEYTQRAFGVDVAKAIDRAKPITPGAISQWLSGETRRIGIDVLRGVAEVTGEPIDNLERMVLGRSVAGGVSQAIMDEIDERMRRVIREELAAYLGPRDP